MNDEIRVVCFEDVDLAEVTMGSSRCYFAAQIDACVAVQGRSHFDAIEAMIVDVSADRQIRSLPLPDGDSYAPTPPWPDDRYQRAWDRSDPSIEVLVEFRDVRLRCRWDASPEPLVFDHRPRMTLIRSGEAG